MELLAVHCHTIGGRGQWIPAGHCHTTTCSGGYLIPLACGLRVLEAANPPLTPHRLRPQARGDILSPWPRLWVCWWQ